MTSCGFLCAAALWMAAGPSAGEPLTGSWHFSAGEEFPGAAGRLELAADRIILHYDFAGGGNYVAAYCDLEEPRNLKMLRFHLRKPRAATVTIRVFDADDQCFQKSVYYDDAGDRELAVNMRSWASSWGGPNDGVLRPPIRRVGVLVERQGLPDAEGSISFTVPQLEVAEPGAAVAAGVAPGPERLAYMVTDFGSDCPLARSAGTALRDGVWRLDFAASPRTALGGSLSLFHRPTKLTLRARASEPGAVLVLHLGAHFQNFRRTIGTFDGSDQEFEITLPPDGWEASGAAHETLHYPLRITQIEVQRGTCQADRVDIAFQNISCETAADRAAATVLLARLTPAAPRDGQREFHLSCSAWNLLDTQLEGVVNVQVRNWDGATLQTAELPMSLPSRGGRQQVEHIFTVPSDVRYVEARCVLDCAGQRPADSSSTFTATLTEPDFAELLPAADAALRPESPWGMGVYLYRYSHSSAGLAEMDRAAALAAAAGVKWTREEFNYGMIETAPGVYDFSFFDQLVDTAHRHGLSVYALLSYWSPFVKPYTEEAIAAYCDYARAAVRRYKDRIKHWEIYNEPNIFFWDGPKELYPVLLARAYAAIKEEDPDARVLGISTAGIDRQFIRLVLDADAPFDDLTIHPYRRDLIEHGFIRELDEVAKLVEPRPVWITEMGWSTQVGGGKSEREQAQLLARAYLAAVGAGIRNMGWYNFRNDGDDPFYNEANFGVLRRDLSPKAAYRALATVCRTMAITSDARPVWWADGTGEQRLYALQVADNTAFWAPYADLDVELEIDDRHPRLINLMGEPLPLADLARRAAAPDAVQHVVTNRHEAGDSPGRYVIELRHGNPVFLLDTQVQITAITQRAIVTDDVSPLEF